MIDTEYWNSYYKTAATQEESPFARAVMKKYFSPEKCVLDVGCGNGRDSIFFAQNGLFVTGIDSSKVAIDALQKLRQKNARFVCGDFVLLDGVADQSVDFCYSRFSVHAITLEQEVQFLKNAARVLKNGGLFLAEARSVNDGICGLGKSAGGGGGIFMMATSADLSNLENSCKGFATHILLFYTQKKAMRLRHTKGKIPLAFAWSQKNKNPFFRFFSFQNPSAKEGSEK